MVASRDSALGARVNNFRDDWNRRNLTTANIGGEHKEVAALISWLICIHGFVSWLIIFCPYQLCKVYISFTFKFTSWQDQDHDLWTHQNLEVQALLLALRAQWSAEREVLIKEREQAVTDHYTKYLKNYRQEVNFFSLLVSFAAQHMFILQLSIIRSRRKSRRSARTLQNTLSL